MKMTCNDLLNVITEDIVEKLIDDQDAEYLQANFTPETTMQGVKKLISDHGSDTRKRKHSFNKKKRNLIKFLIAAILVLAMSSACFALRKRDLVKNGGAELISEYNRDLIGKDSIKEPAVSGDEIGVGSLEARRSVSLEGDYQWNSRRIKEVPENVFVPKTIIEFEASRTGARDITPEIIFTNDVMVIFTREDGAGWQLKKGESLTFEAEQYPLERNNGEDIGQWIEYRFIGNGELSADSYTSNERFQRYTFTADEDGEYYIALRCAGTEPLALKEGEIKIAN